MNFFVDFLLTIHLINVKNKEKQCFSIALLAIVVRDKTNIIQLVAGKLGDQVLDVLPLLATHPGLQAAVEQSHVVVEHLVAGEPVPEPLVHLAPGVLALDLHRLVGVQAGHVGGLKENPPLLGFVEAVVPGDADVVLEGSESDSSGSISDPEAEVAPAVRCPPLRNCLERYNGQGNWTGI